VFSAPPRLLFSALVRGFSIALLAKCSGLLAAPDLILHGGRIYTLDARDRVVEAVAIEGARIAAVGPDEATLALAGPATIRMDLGGRSVLPGLIDAHGHLSGLAAALRNVDLVGTRSYEAVIERVAARARSTPPGQWVLGRGWDQNDWPEQVFPHHEALSRAVPDHPVYLTRIDGHAGLANAAALALAGLARSTPDPPGGRIERDRATGEPTGVLVDRAQGLVTRHIPPPAREELRGLVRQAIAQCLAAGLTSVHEPGVGAATIDLYGEMIDAGEFDLRLYAMIGAGEREALERYFERGPIVGYGEGRLTVRAIKVVMDGALGSRGAALLEPYRDDPDNVGLLTTTPEELERLLARAIPRGFQVATHAIGDRANRLVLDAYEAALARRNDRPGLRLRIEHAQVLAVEDIARLCRLGVIPSMQATHATSDMYWAGDRLGPERLAGAYAWRKFLKAGCRIANGSDFPVEGVSPLWGVYAAITRQDHDGWPEGGWRPEERMTRTEALRSFTIDAAYAAFEENEKGSIEPGKFADLVVLSADVMTVPPGEILKSRVEMTFLGGKLVYAASTDDAPTPRDPAD